MMTTRDIVWVGKTQREREGKREMRERFDVLMV
jgi:ketosteroid isomerase-like protein